MPSTSSSVLPSQSPANSAFPFRHRESVVSRFLRYVRVDTQSTENQGTTPSTETQWDLSRMLAAELEQLGAANVRTSEHGIVYAMIPATVQDAGIQAIGFLAHVDTSPAVTGANVKPVVHENYQGGDIVLPGDRTQVITVAQNPGLATLAGDDIITTDGTTLLGSDDKAGVAAIMTLVDVLLSDSDIPHGPVAVAFTVDEEIGSGIDAFDVEGFGARLAYTVDGGPIGELNEETFSARTAHVTFHGKSTHPGTAKGIMVNAIHALAAFVSRLPHEMLPETTERREGFVHPYIGTANVETSTLKVLLRDFDEAALDAKEELLRSIAREVERACAGVRVEIDVKENYRNMREVVSRHPQLMANAMEAARRAGVEPYLEPIRGGTDGSKLTFRGLPCPNIFTGGHNFHGKLEFNSRRGLEKTAETLVHLVRIFAEGGARGEG
ncbi:MAG TPA: peptidase T [Gemmatimonadaceae bacterium]|nr:peptidase T [Gemmatimonadaceae bacterium]